MFQGKKILAVIPARGASKRLPKKNILDLAGKPLIAWSIDEALKSQYLDKVMVTTDDEGIMEVAKKYGAEVPFKRPESLATDSATTFDTIEHAIKYYNSTLGEEFNYVLLLQPTSPLRTSQHIDEAIELLFSKCADAVISVCEMDHSPLWSNTLPEDFSMNNFLREDIKNLRSQDLPKYFRLNGAIYLCEINRFLNEKGFFLKDNIFAYLMPFDSSQDIDSHYDFLMAEFIINNRQ